MVCSSPMQPFGINNATPQFGTAEYARTGGSDACEFCNQSITGLYYRVNGAMACSSCADQATRNLPKNGHAAYVRGLLFGVAAAIVGLILYAAFGIITGWIIGYVSLAVGYMVGKAMMKGSKGLGGRRYQVTAVLLTYAAVSLAAIPIGISQYIKEDKARRQAQVQPQAQAVQQAAAEEKPAPPEQPPASKMNLGAALGYLALLGLASPFLELQDPVHGLIGLVILFVGIQIAWKITAGKPGVEIRGPFDVSSPASV